MNPGTRDRLLTYQTASESEVAAGEYGLTWSDDSTVWAHVREASGRELVRAGQVDAETPAFVTCDYKASEGYVPAGRFREGSGASARYYRIVGVREVGRNDAREFRTLIDYDGGV